jgi:hypothetical protein
MKSSKFGLKIIITGALLALIAPMLLTLDFPLLNFHDTGQIGDTIGGITAPIVSLVGSILIYLALTAQIDANNTVLEEAKKAQTELDRRRRIEYYDRQLDILRQDMELFSIFFVSTDGKNTKEYYTGSQAFAKILDVHEKALKYDHGLFTDKTRPVSPEVLTFLYFMTHFQRLIKNGLHDRLEKDENYVYGAIKFTYIYRIYPSIVRFNFSKKLNGDSPTNKAFVEIFKISDYLSEFLSVEGEVTVV